MKLHTKFTALLALFLLINGSMLAQDNVPKSLEEKINFLIEKLYTVKNFQERFGGHLDNNPDFSNYIEDEDFIDEMKTLAAESALNNYANTIQVALLENMSPSEIDSMILLMESPYGDMVRKTFSLDNDLVEREVGAYVNRIIAMAHQRLHEKDSLLYLQEYHQDLRELMNGVYLDTIFNGRVVQVERTPGKQIETVDGQDLHFEVDWLSNSHYYLINAAGSPMTLVGPDTILVNIYAVEGNKYRYILKFPDGHYEKSVMTKVGDQNYTEEVLLFQYELNEQYASLEKSPLPDAKRQAFKTIGSHPYFPIDPRYRVEAAFTVFEDPEVIKMSTSSGQAAKYLVYGKAAFTLDGKEVELLLYQNKDLKKSDEHDPYLFLPFRDLTSGEETYGGGRYIEVDMPEDPTTIVIDFNKAYQPYCAYTEGYSCPIPPPENFIDHKIAAGVKHLDLGED